MVERQDVQISLRVPRNLRELMRRFLELDTHINESEFIRDAIREKLLNEAPDLYKSLFKSLEEEAP